MVAPVSAHKSECSNSVLPVADGCLISSCPLASAEPPRLSTTTLAFPIVRVSSRGGGGGPSLAIFGGWVLN